MTISIRKDPYFFYKANWTATPTVHINSSLYTERAYRIADVRVYSNAPKTSLKVNGKLVGVLADCPDRICVWNGVVLSPGANNIVATGSFPKGDVEDKVQWHLSDAAAKSTFIDCGALVAGASPDKRFGSDTFFEGGTAQMISGPGARVQSSGSGVNCRDQQPRGGGHLPRRIFHLSCSRR